MAFELGSDNTRPEPDALLVEIADYVCEFPADGALARSTAQLCMFDTLGCGLAALDHPVCTNMLGPAMDGMSPPLGARVPGTDYVLDPVTAAFNIGTLNRWLDFNDAYFGKEGGHPSDNLCGILACADVLSRQNRERGEAPLTMADILTGMIKAHEIQGNIAQMNAYNWHGLDNENLTKVATAAVTTHMLGGTHEQIVNAVSNAFCDGPSLRSYRHAPNTGWRKSWAAADASARGLWHAQLAIKDEMGYPGILTTKVNGFYDAYFGGKEFEFIRPFQSHIMEHVQFKCWPAEFHSQTAIENSVQLHEEAVSRLDEIERIELVGHRHGLNQIDKKGALHNPADRDHCLQYIVAIALLHGDLVSEHYEDEAASDARIDPLREKMETREDETYTERFYNPDDTANCNAMQIFYKDGSKSEFVETEYPLGHPERRDEGKPVLAEKFRRNLTGRLGSEKEAQLLTLFDDQATLEAMAVDDFMALMAKE
ncbi:MAG: 2-methylcitrate dehydratase [Rhodospirillaceae bacterium]|nr:2-methylcitrate dehydratase [Rhodospirillaceae bacterium]